MREIEKQSRCQKQLIVKAFDLLAPGGVMTYSTCTFAPEENESVVDWLLKNKSEARLEGFDFNGFKLSPALEEWNKQEFDAKLSMTKRIWPHENNTGGFYLAKIRKEGDSE
jgi:16S rRNA C967 or C1407 C5-methylase (RsmB/RsmF family)